MICYDTLGYVMLSYDTIWHLMLYWVVLCYMLLYYVIVCISYHVMSYYDVYMYIFINELWAHIQRDHIQKWTRVVQTAIKQWNCEAKLQKIKGNLPRRPQNILFFFYLCLFFFIFLFFCVFFIFSIFLIFFYVFLFFSIFLFFYYWFLFFSVFLFFYFFKFSQFWKVIESIILSIVCYV